MYILSGTDKILKTTYSAPNAPDTTTVTGLKFSENAVTEGEMHALVQYEIGKDRRGVKLFFAQYTKDVSGKLKLKNIASKAYSEVPLEGSTGIMKTASLDVAEGDVLKAFAWGTDTETPLCPAIMLE